MRGRAIALRRTAVLPAARAEVWRALTDAERLSEWLADEAVLDVRPGGEGVFRWRDGSERRAVVEAVEEEHRLAFRWEEEGQPATSVEITLEDADGGTAVTIVESPLPEAPEASAADLAGLVTAR